jgi:6-phosphogluconolactonase
MLPLMRTAVLAQLTIAIVMLGLARASRASEAGAIVVYVGTYTDTTSQGIYRFTIDPVSGVASKPALVAESRNPSFLALHPSGRFLYAVGEVSASDALAHGFVRAFAVDAASGALTLLNEQPSGGPGPCHLIVDGEGTHVLVANYDGGSVAVLPIGPDGRLGPAAVTKHEGSGPDRNRQQHPHAHGIYLHPAGHFAVSPDLGADRVFVYRFAQGRLTPAGAGRVEPGAGPRHAVFDKPGRRLYVVNELNSTVTMFAVDAEHGALTPEQTVSTLPDGLVAKNWPAEIDLSPDGRHLYASNRGRDDVAVFDVNPTSGRLALKGHVPAGGRNPRHFAIDPTGAWMLVAHQNDDSIRVFRVDTATGLASPAGPTVQVAKPVCVLVVPQAKVSVRPTAS